MYEARYWGILSAYTILQVQAGFIHAHVICPTVPRQDSIRPYRAHAVLSGHCNIILYSYFKAIATVTPCSYMTTLYTITQTFTLSWQTFTLACWFWKNELPQDGKDKGIVSTTMAYTNKYIHRGWDNSVMCIAVCTLVWDFGRDSVRIAMTMKRVDGAQGWLWVGSQGRGEHQHLTQNVCNGMCTYIHNVEFKLTDYIIHKNILQ